MSWKGQVALDGTLYFLFTTRRFSSGAPYTLAGTPALSAYEENNLTQITAGVSVTADYDGLTGLNQATVVATTANGYETGKRYDIVITTGTVDSVSVVGEVVGSFMVGPALANVSQFAGQTVTCAAGVTVLASVGTAATSTAQTGDTYARLGAPAGASVSADVAAVKSETAAIVSDTGTDGVVVAAASKTGYTLTATTGLGNQTANITGDLSGSVGSVTGAVGSVTGAVGSVTGNVGGNVTGTVGTVNAIADNAITAAAIAADAGNELADAILARDIGSGTGAGSSEERTVRSALRVLRNKFGISGTTRTVYKEDDTTAAFTSVLTTDAAAVPIIGDDPT